LGLKGLDCNRQVGAILSGMVLALLARYVLRARGLADARYFEPLRVDESMVESFQRSAMTFGSPARLQNMCPIRGTGNLGEERPHVGEHEGI
jgi:hypothetical protein